MLLENQPYPQDPRVRQEAQTLRDHGYLVTVVCPKAPRQRWREEYGGIHVYRFPAPRGGRGVLSYMWEYGYSMVAMFAWSLLALMKQGFDVVHAHNPPDTLVLIGIVYKALGKRFVFDHHDLAPDMYATTFRRPRASIHRALRFFERLSCRVADHVIATNESYMRTNMDRNKLPRERITVVRNGPDLARVCAVDADKELRKGDKFIIGYVGDMGAHDGVDYLLRALHHLLTDLKRDNFLAIIVGKGDALSELTTLAEDLELNGHVRFTGRISDADLMRYLSSCHVCVDPDPWNPYNDRSTMIKMSEYMALGKPIVAFDLSEHRITAEKAAVYARPNDEHDFARKIAFLWDNPIRRREMGVFGKARVQSSLAWKHQEAALLGVYESVLGPANALKRRAVTQSRSEGSGSTR